VSPDKPAAQAKFKRKYDLPFTLLADEEKAAAEAYGVWKEKNMYGRRDPRSTPGSVLFFL
jgi:peroxiredoxin Q/BCP